MIVRKLWIGSVTGVACLPSPLSMGPKAGFKELRPEPQAFKSRAQIDR